MRTNTRKIWIAGLATVASLGATPQNTELIDAAKSADATKVATLSWKHVHCTESIVRRGMSISMTLKNGQTGATSRKSRAWAASPMIPPAQMH